jgi:hypothetical protein
MGNSLGQAAVALTNLGLDLRVPADLLGDALGAHGGGLVVHPVGPDHAAEQGAALGVAEGGGLMAFCLFLPEMNALRPGRLARGRRA